MPYIFQAALWCDSCGAAIRERLRKEGKAPEDMDDEHSYDSDDFPKYVASPGESDSTFFCDSREECLEPTVIEHNGLAWNIGADITDGLTSEGVESVQEFLTEVRDGTRSTMYEHALANYYTETYPECVPEED